MKITNFFKKNKIMLINKTCILCDIVIKENLLACTSNSCFYHKDCFKQFVKNYNFTLKKQGNKTHDYKLYRCLCLVSII